MKEIIKKGKQVELKDVWLLYNFERYVDYFWTKKEAWRYAYNSNFDREDTVEIYQVFKGNLKIISKFNH